ncbi:MAG TPA: sulfate ABC transporter substrate-binding protein [Thermoleophilaceae bacterium]|jgi:sulfate transport system substrate-binding protein
MPRTRPANHLIAAALVLVLALAATACGGSGGGSDDRISLVGYSTPKEAYAKLTEAFKQTPEGEGVEFSQSFAASGEQSRAVASGLPADIVALSLQPDVDKLVEPKKVAADWNKDRYEGFVTRSVVVLAVRKGNPKNIRRWEDLTRDGIEVIEPNPFTSGGARWNVMAAYGSQTAQGKSDAEAQQFLKDLFDNVTVQDKSARDSLQTFGSGKGDVLLAYENEAIAAQKKGVELDYVIPDQTILIENPIAVTEEGKDNEKATAFLKFLRSEAGQRIFVEEGYRPVLESVNDEKRFPKPKQLFEIGEFGGWSEVNDKFFDPDKGVMAEINKAKGVSTGG